MLVGDELPIAVADRVDLADQAERRVGQFELGPLAVLVGGERGVQLAAGVDPGVGDADLLDFFEVEQALAVGQRVEGHDPQGRVD